MISNWNKTLTHLEWVITVPCNTTALVYLPTLDAVSYTHLDVYKRQVKYQEPETEVWWQVTDQNNRKGNYLESSASSLFVYFLSLIHI